MKSNLIERKVRIGERKKHTESIYSYTQGMVGRNKYKKKRIMNIIN